MQTLLTPSELPKWVPGEMLVASDPLGWKGVALRGYRYRGLDVQVPPLRDYTVVSYRQGSTRMQRRFDGAWTRAECGPGDVSLLTRSQTSHWHWTEDIEVCHVYLSGELVTQVAEEVLERSVADVRLHDVLRTQDPIVTRTVDAIVDEARAGALGGPMCAESLGTQLAVHLLRRHAAVSFRERPDASGLSPLQRRRVLAHVEEHLHESIGLAELARAAQLGSWTFGRRFRASFGCAPHAYIVEQRVQRASRLLAQGVLPVKQVASACGFADQAHMTRVFRARLQTTPALLRRSS